MHTFMLEMFFVAAAMLTAALYRAAYLHYHLHYREESLPTRTWTFEDRAFCSVCLIDSVLFFAIALKFGATFYGVSEAALIVVLGGFSFGAIHGMFKASGDAKRVAKKIA